MIHKIKGCSYRKGCNSGKVQEKRNNMLSFLSPLALMYELQRSFNTQNIVLISDERNILPLKGIHPPPLPWQNWFGVALTLDHKKCIENEKWLWDYIIHASQMLLKNTYPNLQNPLLAVNFSMEPCQKEFIQILNLNNNHWITVSIIGCSTSSINVYDSMHLKLSNELKKVVADVMKSSSDGNTVMCNGKRKAVIVDSLQLLLHLAFAVGLTRPLFVLSK